MDQKSVLRRTPSLLMAWRNLGRNGVRTGLAVLGILIAVVAIAAIGMSGTAITYSATIELGDLTNEITVTPGEDNTDDTLSDAQVLEIERIAVETPTIPKKTDEMTVSSGMEDTRASVEALTEASELYEATEGQVPDRLRSGAVISDELADELGVTVGQTVSVAGDSYRIHAVFDTSDQPSRGGASTIVLPESALFDQEYDSVTLIAADGDAATALSADIEEHFNRREEIVNADTDEGMMERVTSLFDTLNAALMGVGSISLIVAGVSILNVMLMSTIERRGEIAILRSVGIKRSQVMRMIVAEAMLLGVVGSVVGAVLSITFGYGLNSAFFGDPLLVFRWESFKYVVGGFGIGVLVSLLSGLYPAWKAANDPPVEALRG